MEEKRVPATFQFTTKPHLLVVEARFYEDIGALQMQGVKAVLDRAGATYETLAVPGALEIPAAIMFAMAQENYAPRSSRVGGPCPEVPKERVSTRNSAPALELRELYDGYVALGCVIKGGTMHDEIVGFESARGLQDIAIRHALAIGNGILTCNNREQALERADPARMDRAGAAADAALRMIEIKQNFGQSYDRRATKESP